MMGGKRAANKPVKRRTREVRKKLLIVVEGDKGKSEQIYFQRIQKYLPQDRISGDVEVAPGCGEPSKVFSACKSFQKKGDYDEVCMVVDRDDHAKLEDVIRESRKLPHPISVVVTNPQFELWLLWHRCDQNAFIGKSELEQKVKNNRLVHPKDDKKLHDRFPYEEYKSAMDRAKRVGFPGRWKVGENPSSGIPWLFDRYFGQE